jgi:hypothetical protein
MKTYETVPFSDVLLVLHGVQCRQENRSRKQN